MLQNWGERAQHWGGRLPLVRLFLGHSLEEGPEKVIIGTLALLLVGLVAGGLNRGAAGALVGGLSGACLGAMAGGAIAHFTASKAGKAALTIELASGDAPFSAGDAIDGYVRITSDARLKTGGAKAYLTCRGVYVYDQPSQEGQPRRLARRVKDYVVQEMRVSSAGVLSRGMNARYPLHFVVPRDALPTHQGYACSIEWSLYATLDLAEGAPAHARQELLVAAIPPSAQLLQEAYQAVHAAEICQLAMTLDRRIAAEGESVRGHLRISPHESFDADEVRVLLLRVENNPEGENHVVYISQWDPTTGQFEGESLPGGRGSTYVWLEDEANLSGPLHLEAAEPKVFPFELNVPKAWRPTIATAEGRVTWQVVSVVAQASGDLRVSQDIVVHTGAPQLARVLATPTAEA